MLYIMHPLVWTVKDRKTNGKLAGGIRILAVLIYEIACAQGALNYIVVHLSKTKGQLFKKWRKRNHYYI